MIVLIVPLLYFGSHLYISFHWIVDLNELADLYSFFHVYGRNHRPWNTWFYPSHRRKKKTEQKLTNETQHFPIDGWIHSLIVFEKLKLKHWKHFHGFECSSNDMNERKSDGQISNTIDTRLPFGCFISSGKKEIIRYKRFFYLQMCFVQMCFVQRCRMRKQLL